ncbi:MAG: tripartite tricarboxylate transporter substrate binding protein [Micrococcaceae bacterium]
MKRTTLGAVSATAACLLLATGCANTGGNDAGDGSLPAGTIKIIVPFGAGGSLDTNARIMAECLTENTENNWIVENREGGGGTTGVNYMLSQSPNGATVGYVSSSGIALTPMQVDEAEYTMDDVAPLATITGAPSVLVTSADSGISSLQDLLPASGEGSQSTLATTGALGVYQLVAQQLAEQANVRAVPFEGAAAATTAALGNTADAAIVELSDAVLEHTNSGRLIAIGTGSDEPVEDLPDAEPLSAAGFETALSTNYGVFVGSPNLHDDVKAALETTFVECGADSTVIDRIGDQFVLDSPYGQEESTTLLEEANADYSEALQ